MGSNIVQNHSSSLRSRKSLFVSIHMNSRPNVKLGEVGVCLNIAQNHSCAKNEFTSGHYWPKVYINSSCSGHSNKRFTYLLTLPKVKLRQVGFASNIVQNHSSSP